MTKEQRNKILKQWRIRKLVAYVIAATAIIAGAIIVVKGIFTTPTEQTWMLASGIGLIIVGMLIFPDIWKETFSQYLQKKGL